jgi:hypothetical protein
MADETKLKFPTADDYEAPPVRPDFERQETPGPVARGLSTALMQGAFAKFGQAFTDTGDVRKDAQSRDSRMAPWIQAGAGAASALEARWHTMEYENFQAEHVEPYIAKKRAMLDDYQRRHAQADDGIFEGPNGDPMPVDITTKEGRLRAGRMRGQMEKRFYAINSDMDLTLFGEAGKYSSNPMIVDRVNMIANSTSDTLSTVANPQQSLEEQEGRSVIRGRESAAEAAMVSTRAQAANVKSQKRPKSFREAVKHPDVGVGGIVQWFVSDPDGIAVMNSPGGGASYLAAEEKTARGDIMAQNPDLKEGDPVLESKLKRAEPQWKMAAVTKYLESLDPAIADQARMATPHFFADLTQEKERGIVSDKRQAPEVRQRNVDTWKKHAETHFNEYMENPDNSSDIGAALDDLEQWLGAAVYGDTDEPGLQAVTAARGEGTERYVSDILEQIPEYIRNWWHTKKGSAIAQEENPEETRLKRAPSRRAAQRAARLLKKKNKGLLP